MCFPRVRGRPCRRPWCSSISVLYEGVSDYDAIVLGSGPNGLTAAAALARRGVKVLVIEARDEIGGGTRTAELTLPGFLHDVCSAVHTTGCLSPAFEALELEDNGLDWLYPSASVAHPLDDGDAAVLWGSVEDTAYDLEADAGRYRRLLRPIVDGGEPLFSDILSPLSFPRQPLRMARLGWHGLWSAAHLVRRFSEPKTKALIAGCAGHSILPLSSLLTAGLSLVFLAAGHLRPWPVARGGSKSIATALERVCRAAGVDFELGHEVRSLSELPASKAVLFDTSPKQLVEVAGEELPQSYVERLRRFRMGPGVFKVDWALDGPIPWRAERCLEAATVHVGGTFEEIADSERRMFRGEVVERPYLILTQQSVVDDTRAPAGKHTAYAYCHVPSNCDVDRTQAIEAQVERFAPGFRERILARHSTSPRQLEAYNPAYVGGAITGGVNDFRQFIARPALRLNPYTTPNRRLFVCSQSTPPGGGVHGMCGWHAARTVLHKVFR